VRFLSISVLLFLFPGAQTGLQTKGGPSNEVQMKDPPSKLQMGPQQAVAGGGTSKSGGGTDKDVPAMGWLRLVGSLKV